MSLRLVVGLGIVLFPALATAGPFGGFAADGSYVVSAEKLCQPVKSAGEARSCTKISATNLAELTLEKPVKESGVKARFVATSLGTTISVTRAGDASPFIAWESGAIAGRVVAVYANKAGTAVGVEYESRFGGRMVTEVVGFALDGGATAPVKPATPATLPTATGPDLSEGDLKSYDKHLVTGWKHLDRKKWARAEAAANEALALWPQSAQGLVIVASARARQKDKDGALEALERLAASSDSEAPEYRVEARTAKAFETLVADERFRLAVGITPDPKRPPTAYERVMGFGGIWEQRLIACEQAEVRLTLKRVRKRFTLRIRSRCGGTETTSLDGTWQTGADTIKLTFPNLGADDEGLALSIERCRDSSGEDCVRGNVGDGEEFLLRVIRR